jgi:voltage-gated potassium channel
MKSVKEKINNIIFNHDTKWSKRFDIWLIVVVMISVLTVMVETVESLSKEYKVVFFTLEWFFTVLFSLELFLRLYSTDKKFKYIFSFYGIVDIISILPSYLSFFIPGAQNLLIIRALRMLRIFRILKLNQYTEAGVQLQDALIASRAKITVFLGFIMTSVLIIGAVMYLIEDPESGFTSIPKSVYWASVTMTTVGYGDITPQTVLGQILSSGLMVTGYGVLAVPTGIVTAEMTKQKMGLNCPKCSFGNPNTAKFCQDCGNQIKN